MPHKLFLRMCQGSQMGKEEMISSHRQHDYEWREIQGTHKMQLEEEGPGTYHRFKS